MPANQITDAARLQAEEQIRSLQREVDYQTKEFTVELLVDKYLEGRDDDQNEIYIPAYQRQFVWSAERQSKFIESVLLGLPIPYIFISSLPKDIEEDLGRAEIVDGSQRVRTLSAFLGNSLKLLGLDKLNKLNGFCFRDLEISRQRKFKRQPIRVIELSDKADEAVRRDIFERINTGSEELRDMEKRKGIYTGPFYEFIRQCAASASFRNVCPVSYAKQRREEAEELVLRYFAYSAKYLSFRHSVQKFLDGYMKEHRDAFDQAKLHAEFEAMVQFATNYLPYGFRKGPSNNAVPRVRFEALACGITLAQRVNPNMTSTKEEISDWLESPEFQNLVVSDGSNSLPRLRGRIEFVRDKLLGVAHAGNA
jgi:hypothetical protein